MRRRRRIVVLMVLGLAGCRFFVSLDDLRGGSPLDDAGGEAAIDATAEAATTGDANPDTNPDGDAGTDVVDARGTTDRIVACQASPWCALQTQACCIVYYDNALDYCYDAGTPSDCVYGAAKVVRAVCDDDNDCAELGMPGTVCCGFVEGAGFDDIACVAPASCTNNAVRLCDSIEKQCPGGGTCKLGPHSAAIWECQ